MQCDKVSAVSREQRHRILCSRRTCYAHKVPHYGRQLRSNRNNPSDLKVRGRQNLHIHFIHFPESAEFSDNFDSNIGAQCFVNREKFAFEVDDLQNRRRKCAAMTVCDDVMSLAYSPHESISMTSIGYGLA